MRLNGFAKKCEKMDMDNSSVTRNLVISKRLQALVDLVTPGNRVVDVGCDHGFVAIRLVQQGISPHVIAMDVRKGPLSGAAEHIAQWQMEDRIETRLSDGLEAFAAGEAETMVCAGMGGPLMMRILADAEEKAKSLRELILQPQSELMEFRQFLRTEGYRTMDEHILVEEGKYYFLFKVCPREKQQGEEPSSLLRMYDKYGQLLLERRDPVLHQFLTKNLKTTEQIIEGLHRNPTERGQNRLKEMEEEREDLRNALRFYEDAIP